MPPASWTDVFTTPAFSSSLRPTAVEIPTYTEPGPQYDVLLVAVGWDPGEDRELLGAAAARGAREVLGAPGTSADVDEDAPVVLEVEGRGAASARFTAYGPVRPPAGDDTVAVEVWLTASGDDPASSMRTLVFASAADFAIAAERTRARG